MNEKKIELRILLKKIHSDIDENLLKNKSILLNKEIIDSEEYEKAKMIFSYISFEKEVGTFYLLEQILKDKKILCVPHVIDKNRMIAAKTDSLEHLVMNKYGIPEPENIIEVSKNDIDLAIVPALGYNYQGFRIGYGGGFYDNYLSDFKGKIFGITLKEFLIEEFNPDKHDIPVTRLFIQ